MSPHVLLCDADGNLFPSEDPAFEASAEVTNRMLADLGQTRRYTAAELRAEAVGRNFRSLALELATRHDVSLGPEFLERWVAEERRTVTARLEAALRPDPDVRGPLESLASRMRLAVVSSSALSRLDACLRASGLADLFPEDVRFSAEDSLPAPASKPDPAVYELAGATLAVTGAEALAVEDADAGVSSAVSAGFPVVGNLIFTTPAERAPRAAALRDAGAHAVVESWWALCELLDAAPTAA